MLCLKWLSHIQLFYFQILYPFTWTFFHSLSKLFNNYSSSKWRIENCQHHKILIGIFLKQTVFFQRWRNGNVLMLLILLPLFTFPNIGYTCFTVKVALVFLKLYFVEHRLWIEKKHLLRSTQDILIHWRSVVYCIQSTS